MIVSSNLAAASEWYEGGNLHQKTLAEWAIAGYSNRLATAGDFTASMMEGQVSSMSEVKRLATKLERCISETAREKTAGSVAVSEVAATCAVLMGWR